MNKILPNLIGCGAGKSGTTSLFYYLSQHPEISMTSLKETHYFSENFHKGLDWYCNLFSQTEHTKIIGEFSTSYMLNLLVPERIAGILPDTKLLFIFRNPIDRAYSNYWFSRSIGTQNPDISFSEVIRSKKGQEEYIFPGFYFQHIQRFLNHFREGQILILITEHLSFEPIKTMSYCYKFLGVDSAFKPEIHRKFNVTFSSDNKIKVLIDQTWLRFKRVIRPMFVWVPNQARYKFSHIENSFRSRYLSTARPTIDEADIDYLSTIYDQENDKLASYLGIDLPWNSIKMDD